MENCIAVATRNFSVIMLIFKKIKNDLHEDHPPAWAIFKPASVKDNSFLQEKLPLDYLGFSINFRRKIYHESRKKCLQIFKDAESSLDALKRKREERRRSREEANESSAREAPTPAQRRQKAREEREQMLKDREARREKARLEREQDERFVNSRGSLIKTINPHTVGIRNSKWLHLNDRIMISSLFKTCFII